MVSVHNEWDPLEEIIVGTLKRAHTPRVDISNFSISFSHYYREPSEVPTSGYSRRVISETEEDLDILTEHLKELGIRVRRPIPHDHSREFSTPYWKSEGFYNYCPRDTILIVGSTVIEAPSPIRSRYFENFAYRHLMSEYLRYGARWIAAPPPILHDSCYRGLSEKQRGLSNQEPLFEAANVLRLGRDLLYLVSSSGNEMGCCWLSSALGKEYRVHPCRGLYASTHIDSTLIPLRAGLMLANPERVNEENLPGILRQWDLIKAPDMVDPGFEGNLPFSSKWVGMNILMINPQLAVVDSIQRPLIKQLEGHGIDVLPLRLRHCRTLGGGFHCVTLDVRRRGEMDNYFSKRESNHSSSEHLEK